MEKDVAFWNRCISLSKNKLAEATYDFYVATATFIGIQNDQAVILVDSEVKKLFWETSLEDIILTAGFEIFEREIHLKLVLDPSEYEEIGSNSTSKSPSLFMQNEPVYDYSETNLQRQFTFENFVQGDGNNMACGASLAVASRPGGFYNPLFIYGGPGLGKTHLLHAIGNEILLNYPTKRIKYITTENFLNEYTKHLRLGEMEKFRDIYRNLDLLLLDDVQFLSFGARKVETEKELFNIFEELKSKEDRQIVLTSDRTPTHLDNLDNRLKQRFGWGVTIDITPPDLETRLAIITSKVDDLPFDFPYETKEYIASQFDTNIRELEGGLNTITFQAQFQGISTISLDFAAAVLRTQRQEHSKSSVIPIELIQEEVGKFYGISVKELKGSRRIQNIVRARQVAMYLSRELTDNSLPRIGREFGGKDHTTVMHAYTKIQKSIEEDPSLNIEISNIKKKLQQ